MRWLVQATDVVGMRLVRDLLEALSMTLLDENDEHFIVSQLFEELDSAADVRELAARARSIIEETADSDSEIESGFKLGSVFEQAQDGTRKQRAFATAM